MSTLTTYDTSVGLMGYDALAQPTRFAAIQAARRRVFGDRRWSFMEGSSSALSTVAGTGTVSLATITDLAHIDAVRLSDATGAIPVQYRPRQIVRDLLDRYPTAPAVPLFWTRVKGTILFYPSPSAVLTVTVEYTAYPGDLAVSPAVDVIPDFMQDLIVWAAVVPLAFRQRDFNASSAADQMYTKVLLPKHIAQDGLEQRQTSEQIRTGWWGRS